MEKSEGFAGGCLRDGFLAGTFMAPDLKRVGSKIRELEPLDLRRLKRKPLNRLRRKKRGLRRRLREEDHEESVSP
ncbi:MAG: hypothetical protein SVQ76_01095 [Candidatus Nanohaloarchaea archaeon]|nr:hypothetical protein [Candidatus Nanohaloarchaea archaeon]